MAVSTVTLHPLTLRFSDAELEASMLLSRTLSLSHRSEYYAIFAAAVVLIASLSIAPMHDDRAALHSRMVMQAFVTGLTIVFATFFMSDKLCARQVQQIFLGLLYASASLTTHLNAASGEAREQISFEDASPVNVVQVTGRCAALQMVLAGLHVLHACFPLKLLVAVLPVVDHVTTPIWAIGPVEGVMFGVASIIGLVIGYLLERSQRNFYLQLALTSRARREQIESERRDERRRLEHKAHRVLNHTAKRVMANASQSCRMAISRLRTLTEQKSVVDSVVGMLNTTLSECITGYHMCRTAIIASGLESGEYSPSLETFNLTALFDDLGFAQNSRIVLEHVSPLTVRADLQVLSVILFNAVHNAIIHGDQEATVSISTQMHVDVAQAEESLAPSTTVCGVPGAGAGMADGAVGASAVALGEHGSSSATMHVTVLNRAGANHAALCAMDKIDLLADALSPSMAHAFHGSGIGSKNSTFLGLSEIYRAAKLLLAAETHLWVRPDTVCFELRTHVEVVEPACDQPPTAETSDALPPGLVFVCCDDDEIPRIYAHAALLPGALADKDSVVLGETYAEAVGVPDLVMALAEKHGHEQVFGIFDQNLTNYDEGDVFGTELCSELRRRGFRGSLVIQSANDSFVDQQDYLTAGANGSIPKALRGGVQELVCELGAIRGGKACGGGGAMEDRTV